MCGPSQLLLLLLLLNNLLAGFELERDFSNVKVTHLDFLYFLTVVLPSACLDFSEQQHILSLTP